MSYTLELPDRLKSPPPQAWTLGVIFLLGWSFSLIILPFYSRLASLWPPGSMGPIIFLDLALLAMGIGGLWWGDAVKGESAATAPLLALTLMGGAIFFLLAPCLLPALPLEKELNSGLASFFRQRIWLALLVLTPGFFLWGAAPPFLTALAFPQDRGLSTGIFPLCGLTLVALALGALESLWRPQNPSIWMSRLIGWPSIPILIVGIWLWLKTPPENRENLPFWPNSSLGLWTGDRGYGLDILVSPRRAKTLTPALFIGILAGTLAATSWLCLSVTANPTSLWPLWPLIIVPIAIGAIILGPILAILTAPMTALALDLLLLTLILAFGSKPPAIDINSWWTLGALLTTLGALWPLAARVSLVRYSFIPAGLGHINFWLMLGILIGLTVATTMLAFSPNQANLIHRMALIGSITALAISWRWLWGFLAFVALGTWHLLSWT